MPPLPRIGLRFAMPAVLVDSAKWFGLGPHEAYDDRNACVRLGHFASSIDKLHVMNEYELIQISMSNEFGVIYSFIPSLFCCSLVLNISIFRRSVTFQCILPEIPWFVFQVPYVFPQDCGRRMAPRYIPCILLIILLFWYCALDGYSWAKEILHRGCW